MMVIEITVKSLDGDKLTVEGLEGEEFEDVAWTQAAGVSFKPKVGSKGLAIAVGGSPDRLRVISIDEHSSGDPISFADSRGQKVELGSAGILLESSIKIEINAPIVKINDILQTGD